MTEKIKNVAAEEAVHIMCSLADNYTNNFIVLSEQIVSAIISAAKFEILNDMKLDQTESTVTDTVSAQEVKPVELPSLLARDNNVSYMAPVTTRAQLTIPNNITTELVVAMDLSKPVQFESGCNQAYYWVYSYNGTSYNWTKESELFNLVD